MSQSTTINLFWPSFTGKIPSTAKYEGLLQQQSNDYERYLQLLQTEKIESYKSLADTVHSDTYQAKRKEINSLTYKGSKEQKEEAEFRDLQRNKLIKNYFNVLESSELKWFQTFEQSETLQKYQDLSNYYQTVDLAEIKQAVKTQRESKENELKQQIEQYKQLKKSLKWYFTFLNSADYKNYKQAKDSQEVARYYALKNEDRSPEEENAFKKLKKHATVKAYSKLVDKPILKRFYEAQESQELAGFMELKEFIESDEFSRLKEEIKEIKFENSEEFKTLQELKQLQKSADIKRYEKFRNSKAYKNFLKVQASDMLKRYYTLKEHITSSEFKERKAFLQAKDRFSLTEEYDTYKAYQDLQKDDDVQWFLKIEKEQPFGRFTDIHLTFEDTFAAEDLDKNKWLTLPYSGKVTMNDTYAQANDEHLITKGENLQLQGQKLHILTKSEKREGKAWHPTMGFLPKTFSASTGMINTGESLQQQYGLVEAKIKVQKSAPVYHAFWLKGSQALPHVEVFKFDLADTKSLHINTFAGDIQQPSKMQVKVKGLDFSKNYFIFTLEWTASKLVWKVNGYTVFETSQQVPQIPLFLNIASGVQAHKQSLNGNNDLAVDWVRVYQWR